MIQTDSINPQFVQSVTAIIAYWDEQTSHLNEQAIMDLDKERQNLYRAVEYGLALNQTWRETAVLAVKTFPLIERRGYWQDWIPILTQAISRCADQDSRLKCTLLNRLAQAYRLNRQLEEAIDTLKLSQHLAYTLNDQQAEAEIDCHLSEIYMLLRKYDQAAELGRKAMATFQTTPGNERWLMSTFNTLGEIYRNRGDTITAASFYQKAVQIAREQENLLYLVRFLNNQALNFQWAQKFDDALSCLTEAKALLQPTDNKLDKIMLQNNLGILFYQQQNWQAAEKAFHQANNEYLRRSPNIHLHAQVVNNLGNVFIKQGIFEEAALFLRRAVQLWHQLNDDLERANSLGSLAEALAGGGETAVARKHYEKAIQLLTQFPDHAWANKLKTDFQQQYQQLGSDDPVNEMGRKKAKRPFNADN